MHTSWDMRSTIFTSGYRPPSLIFQFHRHNAVLEQSSRVARHQKHRYSRWNIVAISYIQAEIYVIPYSLPVTRRHLWYITHPDVGECFWTSKWLFPLEVRWYLIRIVRSLLHPVFKPPVLFCLGTCVSCWMFFFRPINHSFIHFEFLWAWHIIWRHWGTTINMLGLPYQSVETASKNSGEVQLCSLR